LDRTHLLGIEAVGQSELARNPMPMDYYKKYQDIIADYNREKDRVTVEETFAKLRHSPDPGGPRIDAHSAR